MGKSMSNAEFVLILMGLLPLLYQLTLSGIAAAAKMSTTTPTVTTVTKHAIDKYDRCTLISGKPQDQAFAADAQKKKEHNVECFNCEKKGHVKADCWVKGGGKEGPWPKRKGGSVKETDMKADAAESTELARDKAGDIEPWTVIAEVKKDEEESPQVPAMVANEQEAQRQNCMILEHLVICPHFMSDLSLTAKSLLILSLQPVMDGIFSHLYFEVIIIRYDKMAHDRGIVHVIYASACIT